MIEQNDLRAAVAAGIVSEAQAANLAQLAHARQGARADLAPGDEPFELFKGFNEIFIVVGLVILATGWSGAFSFFVSSGVGGMVQQMVYVAIAGAVFVWAMAEYFVRIRRMVAPAITLSIFWAINASIGFVTAMSHPFMVAQEDFSSLPAPLTLATITIGVFWIRFRVPFAMAMMAVGAFVVAIVWTATGAGTPQSFEDIFLLSGNGPFAWITLILGLVVFIAAMAFDMSDPSPCP